MVPSRRTFLGSALLAAVGFTSMAVAQRIPPRLPGSNSDASDPLGPPFSGPKFNPRDMLAANQKGIRKDVARLSEIVQQLQKQLEDNDIKDVLPLDVIHQTEEIQKLAKHINSLVRG